MYAKITKDIDPFADDRTGKVIVGEGLVTTHIHGPIIETTEGSKPKGGVLVCRLLDDDRNPYFEAEADDEALEWLLAWGEADSGCTILQVKDDLNGWKDVIS